MFFWYDLFRNFDKETDIITVDNSKNGDTNSEEDSKRVENGEVMIIAKTSLDFNYVKPCLDLVQL